MTYWKVLSDPSSEVFVSNRTALKALDTSIFGIIYLTEDERSGKFVFRSGDYSSLVALDTQEGIYIKADDTLPSVGAWVREFKGPANITWFGVVGDDATDNTTAINVATNVNRHVYMPKGTYIISSSWRLPNNVWIEAESPETILKYTGTTGSIIDGNLTASGRNYWLRIDRLKIQGPGKSTGTVVGLDLHNWTYVRTFDVWISKVSDAAVRHGGGGQSSYYNTHYSMLINDCGIGGRNGALGNEITFYGSRVGNVVLGFDDNENSGAAYFGCAVEVFTLGAFRVGTGAATVNIRYVCCRTENPVSGYDTAVHYR